MVDSEVVVALGADCGQAGSGAGGQAGLGEGGGTAQQHLHDKELFSQLLSDGGS